MGSVVVVYGLSCSAACGIFPDQGSNLHPQQIQSPIHGEPFKATLCSSRRRRRCQVAFSYLPQNDDELELKVGDIIEVVGEVEEGWWEGVLNGKTGMFPSNFIKELSGESDDLGISQDDQLSKSRPEALLPPASLLPFPAHGAKGKTTFEGTILYRAAPGKTEGHRRYYSLRETTGSESDGGDSSSTKSEGANGTVATAAIQPKKVKGVGFGDIFKDKPIKLRPRSIEVENDFLPVEKVSVELPPTSLPPSTSNLAWLTNIIFPGLYLSTCPLSPTASHMSSCRFEHLHSKFLNSYFYPYTYMYLFLPKPPSHPGCHITLNRLVWTRTHNLPPQSLPTALPSQLRTMPCPLPSLGRKALGWSLPPLVSSHPMAHPSGSSTSAAPKCCLPVLPDAPSFRNLPPWPLLHCTFCFP
ncbi:hypothetical protein FD754_021969 [Muntiacus muntjak]|uniref:SH3 domain-containing protein n=1 Tax=Muntiacus muntjak TaxID=9888 RepID=A0A5N3V797_MUNMU|nr:hypothetical protein FD754_021969 [Muntiacus muntjak]